MKTCVLCDQRKPNRGGRTANGAWVCPDCCYKEDKLWDRDPAYTPGESKWHSYESNR